MFYILHGEDEFSRTERVKQMRVALGDPQFADLNCAIFDGRKVGLGELQHACNAVPFLTAKRLVIVEGMLASLEPRRKKGEENKSEEIEEEINPNLVQGLKEYLPRLPDSTELLFVEPKALAKNNPVLKLALAEKRNARVEEFSLPELGALPGWIERRIAGKGGSIEPDAAEELAQHVGADLRLLDNETEKLIAYRGKQVIRTQDVQMLVPSVREASIFALVDAVGARQTTEAARLLHMMLDQNAAPLYLLAMITRQFRILLQIKDLVTRGKNQTVLRNELKLHPFVVEKTSKQASSFTLEQLVAIYERLLETDLAIKTSRSDPVVALDMLIVELTGSIRHR